MCGSVRLQPLNPPSGEQSGGGTYSCAVSCLHLQDEHVLTRALGREQRQLSILRTQLGEMLFKMDNLPVSLSTTACR